MTHPPEPTADQCSSNAPLGNGWYAIWYPSMGGYAGKAVVYVVGEECLEVYVWHDGEFPFCDGDTDGWKDTPKQAVNLHHCDSDDFRRFADQIDKLRDAQ